jgi:hypothetical protein
MGTAQPSSGRRPVARADRAVALHRGAVQGAGQMRRAAGGQVDGGAVVPEHQVMRLPAVPVLELRLDHVCEQPAQQRVALRPLQLGDVGGEALIDEQRLAAGGGVDPHHRMGHRRHRLGLVRGQAGPQRALGLLRHVAGAVVVHGREAFDLRLGGVVQRVIGRGHADEQRVALDRRQRLGVQQRSQARLGLVGQVGMPVAPGIGQAQRLAILPRLVRDDQDLRMPGQVEMVLHMDLQLAEAAAEVDVLLRRDPLVAEHHDRVRLEQRLDPGEGGVVRRGGEVEPGDLEAQQPGQGTGGEGHGGVSVSVELRGSACPSARR